MLERIQIGHYRIGHRLPVDGDGQGTLAQAAIRFVLAHPEIACVNFGARTLDEFEDGVAAIDREPMSDSVMPIWMRSNTAISAAINSHNWDGAWIMRGWGEPKFRCPV